MKLRTIRRRSFRRKTEELSHRQVLRLFARAAARLSRAKLFRLTEVTTKAIPPAIWPEGGGLVWVAKPQPYVQWTSARPVDEWPSQVAPGDAQR